jgi:hypothetical protein
MDWIWICLLALWEHWWPDKVCLELLDDKIQAGYDRQQQRDLAACAATWLDAWADVLRLCDATGIGSIDEFDDRFPLTQSLYNWLSDVVQDGTLSRLLPAGCDIVTHRSGHPSPAAPAATHIKGQAGHSRAPSVRWAGAIMEAGP